MNDTCENSLRSKEPKEKNDHRPSQLKKPTKVTRFCFRYPISSVKQTETRILPSVASRSDSELNSSIYQLYSNGHTLDRVRIISGRGWPSKRKEYSHSVLLQTTLGFLQQNSLDELHINYRDSVLA
jgi:hypothetical protein